MWIDRETYWLWASETPAVGMPPTEKKVQFAVVKSPNGSQFDLRVPHTVFDDDIATEINREELAWHERFDAIIDYSDEHKYACPIIHREMEVHT